MSHWQPGYELSRQVPPTSSARSRTTKSCSPASLSLMAMPRPANPVPRMAILCMARPLADRGAGEEEEPDLEGPNADHDGGDHDLLDAAQRALLLKLRALVAEAAHPRRGALLLHGLAAEELVGRLGLDQQEYEDADRDGEHADHGAH